MSDTDWYKHPQYLPDEVKKLEEAEAAYALREAWKKIYGEYPSDKSLAVLWAKSALETGRWKIIHCYNFGNIKKLGTHRGNDDGHFFTMYRCSEILKGKEVWFDPPHYQTHFRAYKTAADGAEDYIRFVSQKKRYMKAWQEVINGDPKAYSHELKVAGYYTASESLYTKGVVRLFDEFMRRKEELMSWTPAPIVEDIEKEETITETNPPPEEPFDTEVDHEIPFQDEIDTEVDHEIPTPPEETNEIIEKNVGGKNNTMAIIALAIAGIGAMLSQLVSSCQ